MEKEKKEKRFNYPKSLLIAIIVLLVLIVGITVALILLGHFGG